MSENKEIIILKVGGSVITDKKSNKPKLKEDGTVLERVVKEIGKAHPEMNERLVLIHGAGSYGHPIVNKTGIDKGIRVPDQLKALSETQLLQTELNLLVSRKLSEHGVPVMPCQASASSIMYKIPEIEDPQLIELSCGAIEGLLRIGMVPLLNGVPSYDIKQGCSILSGDQIAPYLAKRLGATHIIHATNKDGVLEDENAVPPKVIPKITPSTFDQIKNFIKGSREIDITRGMIAKVKPLVELADNFGITSLIINGNKPGNIYKVLLGEEIVSTLITRDPPP